MPHDILTLAIILAAAEAGAVIATVLGLPRVAGQIAAGIVIGPSLLGIAGDGEIVQFLAQLGALCILALAGLETNLETLARVRRPALLAATGGVVLPFAAGAGVALWTGHDARTALFVGAVLTATSVGITTATLRELGTLDSRAGATILGAAVADDVMGLVVLALVVADVGSGGSALAAIGGMLAVGAASVAGAWLFRARILWLLHRLEASGGGLAALLGLVLAVAWAYQQLGGLAGITGAYFAGLMLAGTPIGERLRERLAHTGDAIGAPVFFVAIGLGANVEAAGPALAFAALLVAVAVAGKLVGSGLGARAGGLTGRESTTVGIGMIARGEVALVAAATGVQAGAIDAGVYAALVLVALATTVVTPVLLSLWERRAASAVPSRRAAGPALIRPQIQLSIRGEAE